MCRKTEQARQIGSARPYGAESHHHGQEYIKEAGGATSVVWLFGDQGDSAAMKTPSQAWRVSLPTCTVAESAKS